MSYIEARKSVANKLNLPDKLLAYLFHEKIENFYTQIEIPKKSGGLRKINVPHKQLKSVHKKILNLFRDNYEKRGLSTSFSHGFEKNKSIISNAKLHKDKRYVLNMDLENFFDSFHFGRVRGYLNKNFDFTNEEATVITNLICYRGVLPQGASTSPIVTNMICRFMDFKMINLAKRYRCTYTRYADDLTFSTNNPKIEIELKNFIKDVERILNKAGFSINKKKTRLQYQNSTQKVTGLVVNEKVNVENSYYRLTRAMAHTLYKTGEYTINGEKGTIKQLEGRFSFVDQLNFENNKKKLGDKATPRNFFKGPYSGLNINRRERSYQEFLFYKYFYANDKPIILTEGKTDITYLQSALKKLYKEFPGLIEKTTDGFIFKVQFLHRSRRLNYFLGYTEGASGMQKIYDLYFEERFNYYSKFEKKRKINNPKPVFLIFDNETKMKHKPLKVFLENIKSSEDDKKHIRDENYLHIRNNLYLLTNQLFKGFEEMEMEDLFENVVQETIINGKKFDRTDGADRTTTYGKARFADYISKNYGKINFNNFKPLLSNIERITKYKED